MFCIPFHPSRGFIGPFVGWLHRFKRLLILGRLDMSGPTLRNDLTFAHTATRPSPGLTILPSKLFINLRPIFVVVELTDSTQASSDA